MDQVTEKAQEIREYWNSRAASVRNGPTATTNDVYLRKLEEATLAAELVRVPLDNAVLDVGCGDGRTTIALAKRFPEARLRGIDYSIEMVRLAQEALRAEPDLASRISFEVGDVRELQSALGDTRFSVIMTNRCLINLPDADSQYEALAGIRRHLVEDGVYLGTENFLGGQQNLNAARQAIGLPPIEIRWHNVFFDENEFRERAGVIFSDLSIINFSSAYYYATRVIYSALCKQNGEDPDYEHPIHEVAIRLPWMGDYGPIKLIRARP